MKFIKRYFQNLKSEKRTLRKLNLTMECLVKRQSLHSSAMHTTTSLIDESLPENTELIISLTTYSKRIHDVYLVIESLGEQTIKANKIVLWLDEAEFSIDTLPEILKRQVHRGLDIRFCSNIRSYKKLIPSLKAFSDADIITVDDDILYPHDLVELLLKAKQQFPDHVVGTRAHTMTSDNGVIQPYKQWGFESSFEKNGPSTFLTTGAGTLFPAGILHEDFCDEESFMKLCPSADDIWINLMCVKHAIPRAKIHDDRLFSLRFMQLGEHQDIALNNDNVHQNQNDVQAKRVMEKFNIKLSE